MPSVHRSSKKEKTRNGCKQQLSLDENRSAISDRGDTDSGSRLRRGPGDACEGYDSEFCLSAKWSCRRPPAMAGGRGPVELVRWGHGYSLHQAERVWRVSRWREHSVVSSDSGPTARCQGTPILSIPIWRYTAASRCDRDAARPGLCDETKRYHASLSCGG